ncbi:MAG: hypothetical protein ACE5PV_23130 [Candidatus Poribacteria bacterium]
MEEWKEKTVCPERSEGFRNSFKDKHFIVPLTYNGEMRMRELFAAALVISMFVAIPAASWYYEHHQQKRFGRDARVITLTGTVKHGWVLGRLTGLNYWNERFKNLRQVKQNPIKIKKGARVILRLESADVVHGFSLKGFGILDVGEIKPGHTKVVEFVADKAGAFEFNCNRICGPKHEEMTGEFIVTDTR